MEKTMEEITETFTKVVSAKILLTIRNHYGTLDSFLESAGRMNNRDLRRYNMNFHVDSSVLQRLTRVGGKRMLGKVLGYLDEKRLVYKGKFDRKFPSGKKFSKPSTFSIPDDELRRLFSMAGTEKDPFVPGSSFYTEEEHRLIDRLVLKLGKKRKPYTKSERFVESVKRRVDARKASLAKDGGELTDSEIERVLEDIDFND